MNSRSGQATRSLFTTEARKGSPLCSLQFIGSVLVVIGFFGPWVAHETAALTVTGYELSEFAKFFPQVQGGTVPVRRALFITPLLAGAVSLALIIHRSGGGRLLRLGATILTVLLGLVALPPFEVMLELQYGGITGIPLQLILVAGGVLLTVLTPLARQFSEHVRGMLLLVLALVGAMPALWQVILLRPLVTELHRASIWPGWGFIVCAIGFLMLVFAGLRGIVRS